MTLSDYMIQEKKEEEDMQALKIAWINRYDDLKTTEKIAKKDKSRWLDTIQATLWTIEQ